MIQKKLFSLLSLLLSACFLTLPLSGCNQKDDGLKTVKVSEVTHSIFYAPMYLADALGFFEDEGFEIELTNAGGADNVMSSVLSGNADIGFCGPEAALYVLVGGSTDVPKVFGQLTKKDGSFLVSRKAEPNFQWTDLRGKEILAGRRGGVPAMTFEYILGNHGMQDGVDVNLNYDVAFNLMTSAFEAGTADYCTMFDPVAYEYEAAGKGYVVASVGEASGEIPYTCYMAKQSWLTENKDVAEGFVRAVMKAIKYVNETPAATVAPYLTEYFEATSVDSLAASVDRYKAIDSWRAEMTVSEESFTRLQDVIEGAGELQRRATLGELVDNSIAQKVYQEIYA